jgi:hypothetical protein
MPEKEAQPKADEPLVQKRAFGIVGCEGGKIQSKGSSFGVQLYYFVPDLSWCTETGGRRAWD